MKRSRTERPSLESTKGGRPATGSIVWADPETKTQPIGVRVTKADGKRKVIRFDPGTTAADAIALAPILAERAHDAVEDASDTVTDYAKRWCLWREARGLGCVAGDRARLLAHVFPLLEHRTVRFPGELRRAQVAVDGLQVDDGGMAAEIEEVLSDAEVPCAAALLAREVGERVLDLHTLA